MINTGFFPYPAYFSFRYLCFMQIPTDEDIIQELEKLGVDHKYHTEGISAIRNCMEQPGWDLERSAKLIAKYAALNSPETP